MPVKTGKSPSGTVGTVQKSAKRTEKVTNRLHPIQVEFAYPIGSRIDMEYRLPPDLEEADIEELLESYSSPREFDERLAAVSAQFNQDTISGKTPRELDTKFIRILARRLEGVAEVLAEANAENFGERGPVAFMGLGLDPETINRIIELDYETADNVYSRITKLWEKGHITPIATTPFHSLLPLYQYDFEIRLVCRIAFEFYWPMLKKYNRSVLRAHGERMFVAVFWLPEGAYSAKVLQILHEEFTKLCEADDIGPSHLVLLLDAEQSRERETDMLMKRWNTLRPAATTRDIVSIIYRERLFSDWVLEGHPSTKKQLDRTIAKVDAVLRDRGIDHLWSHFEPLSTLLSTPKSCVNFEQKLIKLTELGYQPCGPDVFVRRKLLKLYGMEDNEPRRTTLRDMTCWSAYADTPGSMVRFRGFEESGGFTPRRELGAERPYARKMPDGTTRKSRGNPCWKPALQAALRNVHRAVVGEPKTYMGGMLGLFKHIVPIRRVPLMMRNVEDFLIRHARVHWKEHFIHHGFSEADIRVDEFAVDTLLANLPDDAERDNLTDQEIATCGVAAEAVYFANHGLSSIPFHAEHIDQRSTWQAVMMMTLAVTHAVHALRWSGMNEEADRIFGVFKEELLDFSNAYTRHSIAAFGVEEKMWRATIKSQVADSDLNIVERAARKVGATHMRTIGYRKEFERTDDQIATSVGHFWNAEINHPNLQWENEVFCGMDEE